MIPGMNHQVEMGWSVLSIFLGVRVAQELHNLPVSSCVMSKTRVELLFVSLLTISMAWFFLYQRTPAKTINVGYTQCHKQLPCGDGLQLHFESSGCVKWNVLKKDCKPLKSGRLAEHILENTLVVGDTSAVGDVLFGSCKYTIFAT